MMTNERLVEIRARYRHYETVKPETAVGHVRELLNEVERLRALAAR